LSDLHALESQCQAPASALVDTQDQQSSGETSLPNIGSGHEQTRNWKTKSIDTDHSGFFVLFGIELG